MGFVRDDGWDFYSLATLREVGLGGGFDLEFGL